MQRCRTKFSMSPCFSGAVCATRGSAERDGMFYYRKNGGVARTGITGLIVDRDVEDSLRLTLQMGTKKSLEGFWVTKKVQAKIFLSFVPAH